MATMMTAARLAFGMYVKVEVSKPQANRIKQPVTMPPKGVRTPDALFTAVLVKLPAVGRELTKLPARLHKPSVSISWFASNVLPFARTRNEVNYTIR